MPRERRRDFGEIKDGRPAVRDERHERHLDSKTQQPMLRQRHRYISRSYGHSA